MATPIKGDSEYSNSIFPKEFVPAEKKLEPAYGMQYAKAIWGGYVQNSSMWNERKQRWIVNRKYAEGMQSVDKYKNRMDMTNSSYLNLDFSQTPVIANIVDNIVGGLESLEYSIQCDAIDPASKTEEDEKRRRMRTAMFLKQYNDQIEQMTGIGMLPKDEFIPESDEEMDIYFQLNYKPAVCMAMEQALDFVMMQSDFQDIREQCLRDLITLKTAAIRKYYDKNFKICMEYIDPVDIITPYSKYSDYRNIPYIASVKKYTIGQLAQKTNEFNDKQLEDIAESYAGKIGNPLWDSNWSNSYEGYYSSGAFIGRPYDNFFINVLEFEFLSVDHSRYSSKTNENGNVFFKKRKDDYEAPKDSKYKVEAYSNHDQFRYEGCWIIGSEYIYDYKKSPNVPREKMDGGYNPRTCLSIRMISPELRDMTNKSHVERMIPHADQMELIHKKLQQFIGKAKPIGAAFDLEGLESVLDAMGSGSVNKAQELMRIYQQTGNVLFRSRDAAGNVINSSVVTPMQNGVGDLGGLMSAWQNELNMLYMVIGYNEVSAGATPDPKASIGVNEMVLQATNRSLRPLNNAFLKLVRMVAKDTSLMIQDKIEFGGGMKDFERAIGKAAVDTIEVGHKLPLASFGIKVDYLPTREEKQLIEGWITLAMDPANPQIDLEDAIMVQSILKKNTKLAQQMLALRKKKFVERRSAETQADIAANGEEQRNSAITTAQAEIEKESVLSELRMKEKAFESELKKRELTLEHTQKMEQIEKLNTGKVDVVKEQNDGAVVLQELAPKPETSVTK